jgi:ATP-dependent DNA helicase RecG
MIAPSDAGGWSITNMGAVLFAKHLDDFSHLKRKTVRVIVCTDTSRQKTQKEQVGSRGYATGFEGLIGFINNLIPVNEVIGQALRKNVEMYPELAVRELVANAIIHQDLFIRGTGPMIEIFSDRMEITNPGVPLVEINRFLDSPPKSRNEALASFMRRVGVCEERGSGVDKVVFETEYYQLPAPVFEVVGSHTKAVLFAHRKLSAMRKEDRIRACYLHSCLKYVSNQPMTNASLRERFGIDPKNSSIVSRIIKDTWAAELIRPLEKEMSRKYARYVPFWS